MTFATECRGVSVHHGSVKAIDRLSLGVRNGETLALLGPSGSGKTTLMYAIAGFLDVTAGEIEISGSVVSTVDLTVPPERRPIGLVFQNYALWPHLDAVHTVAYPIRRAGVPRREALIEAQRLLELVGVGVLSERKPAEMSGGQQQRVGLARALARKASLYLFDEPTAHLDSAVKLSVQREIRRRRLEAGAAAIYSTHDFDEALAISDRVAIIRDGTVAQLGTPEDVYERPVDVWAARLTGRAIVMNVRGVESVDGRTRVGLGGVDFWADTEGTPGPGPAQIIVRPEWVSLGGPIRGIVDEVSFRGSHTEYELSTDFGIVEVKVSGAPGLRQGSMTGLTIRRAWMPSAT